MIVLDASALLAYLFRETGHHIVEKYLESACISTVNLSEVAGRFTRDGLDASWAPQRLQDDSSQSIGGCCGHGHHLARHTQSGKASSRALCSSDMLSFVVRCLITH